MNDWYIDRSKNYYEDNLKSILEIFKTNEGKTTNEIAAKMKNHGKIGGNYANPNAAFTRFRDHGFLNMKNILGGESKLFLDGKLDVSELILTHFLKRPSKKEDSPNIKPFVVICRVFAYMMEMRLDYDDIFITMKECFEYFYPINNYAELTYEYIENIVEKRQLDDSNYVFEDTNIETNLSIWFNALKETPLFYGDNKRTLIPNLKQKEFFNYVSENAEELIETPTDSNANLYNYYADESCGFTEIISPTIKKDVDINDEDVERLFKHLFGYRYDPKMNIYCDIESFGKYFAFIAVPNIAIMKVRENNENAADILTNFIARKPNVYKQMINSLSIVDKYNEKLSKHNNSRWTQSWFHEKGQDFLYVDKEAREFLEIFYEKYSPEKLAELEGEELLNKIFINNDKNYKKNNLCYMLEYDKKSIELFGSAPVNSSYNYGLHYGTKEKSWMTGSGQKKKYLSLEQAIELGGRIRDRLVGGCEVIASHGSPDTIQDYKKLFIDLNKVTDGLENKKWMLKYFAMIYPDILPNIYSEEKHKDVLDTIDRPIGDNSIERMGEIADFIKGCDISNIVFGKVFWNYYKKENTNLKTCFEVERRSRKNKKYPLNNIIYGAPGTGKTYSTVEYALALIENKKVDLTFKTKKERKKSIEKYREYMKNGRIVFTTFHQNYGYEEFVQGLRPDVNNDTISFKNVDGIFKRISDIALNDKDNDYVIIVDEINRANISKVFGELITLIEEDKRWGELNETSVTLQSGDCFAVPNNLYILGTMNSADKSISLIDAALRRRFSFIEKTPDSSLIDDEKLKKVLDVINEKLVEDLDSTDLLVGHSYFMNKKEEDLCEILNNAIIPLIYEYYYDDRKKVVNLMKKVMEKADLDIQIVDDSVARIKVEKEV